VEKMFTVLSVLFPNGVLDRPGQDLFLEKVETAFRASLKLVDRNSN